MKLEILDNELDAVQSTKYLSVQIDEKLNWKECIKTICSEISIAIGFLKHGKSFLPEKTLRSMYAGIVELHFRYCCSVWGCFDLA